MICKTCKLDKIEKEFYISRLDVHSKKCKECRDKYNKFYGSRGKSVWGHHDYTSGEDGEDYIKMLEKNVKDSGDYSHYPNSFDGIHKFKPY